VNLDLSKHERSNTHEFLRKNKLVNDKQRVNEVNAKKRAGYSTNGAMSTFLDRVNSYKLLTSSIGRDENGDEVGASLEEFRIQRVIGTGAYAVVKLAVHELTKKRVALKIYAGNMLDGVKRKAIW
jgi:hypothetical protein